MAKRARSIPYALEHREALRSLDLASLLLAKDFLGAFFR
jgi:hypothetical protein